MKTLPDILHEVKTLLDTRACDHVVIARGGHEPRGPTCDAFQIRIRPDGRDVALVLSECRCEVRAWLGEQWSRWREQRGWLGGGGVDISDVLATDWRIVS